MNNRFGMLLTLLTLFVGACQSDSYNTTDTEIFHEATPAEEPAPTVTGSKGQTLTLVGASKSTIATDYLSAVRFKKIEEAAFDPALLSDEELAESFRSVTSINGHDYISEPDVQRVRDLRAGKRAAELLNDETFADGELTGNEKNCCGNDTREEFPGIGIERRTLLIETGCSAVFINATTAITAAHCVYDTTVNAWRNVVRSSAGTPVWPRYWQRTAGGNPGTWRSYSCYSVHVMQGWVNLSGPNASGAPFHDLAVVDFSNCPSNPTNTYWMGTDMTSYTERYDIENMNGVGYPRQIVQTYNTSIYTGPFYDVWDRLNNTWGYYTIVGGFPMKCSGTMYLTAGAVQQTSCDVTPGDSGRGVYYNGDSSPRVIGTTVGDIDLNGGNPDREINRVWDQDYRDFVELNANFP